MIFALKKLHQFVFQQSMRQYNSLTEAMTEIKFIQYDPLKKPMCAQDLILFQRVKNYKPNDLAQYYPNSEFEEECLHVYGILDKKFSSLLHPRINHKKPTGLLAEVLKIVRDSGEVLARDVSNTLGKKQVTNCWGGKSIATTQALEELRHHGYVRISKRINGNKVYAPAAPIDPSISPNERFRLLVRLMVELLQPISETSLRRAITQLHMTSGGFEGRDTVITSLLSLGDIEMQLIDGVKYYFLAGETSTIFEPVDDAVRFLAPFDPVVWDRKRFEHFWGWAYKFEAYTPEHLRQFGHYALPMFWRDQAIGWVNISKNKKNGLSVERGLVKTPIHKKQFEYAYECEIKRFENVLLDY